MGLAEESWNTNATSPSAQNDASPLLPRFLVQNQFKSAPHPRPSFRSVARSVSSSFSTRSVWLANSRRRCLSPSILQTPSPPAHPLMAFVISVVAGAKRFAHAARCVSIRPSTPCSASDVFRERTRSATSLTALPKAPWRPFGVSFGGVFCPGLRCRLRASVWI